MKNEHYKPRIADNTLLKKLRTSGAVLITGPKWCGKTWTALNASNSVIYLQDPDRRAAYLKMAQTTPSYLLRGDKPRLIDEWQTATVLWDAVRFAVDKAPEKGQFILTGSVVVDEDNDLLPDGKMEHTGTGRISRMRMRPMSLYESGESNGTVSVRDLFNGATDIMSMSDLTIDDIAFAICRGGWPAALSMDKGDALEVAKDYVEAICERDAAAVDRSHKDPDRVKAVLKSLARNISTMTTDRTIMGDVRANDISITDKTLEIYLRALRNLFVIEDVKAWQPSLRSKTGIRTSDKKQFVDPSLAVAAIGATPKTILDDFNYFGFLFESLCVRDMRVYAENIRGTIRHYHDNSGLEADIIITLEDGRWAAVEVKLGSREIEEGAEHLKKLTTNVDSSKYSAPAFLMVLTGGELAYRRDDGVYVVPIGCLRD
ncbi:MAG: DUF4143 domain-containing protein [Paramuribaculum sp.]|nr:DUF4143 domain-containing protein [Paramuribaculum sp.]